MNNRFARRIPAEPLPTDHPGDTLAAVLEKATPEEKAKAEPARQALDQATAQIDSPEKADQVAKRLEELADGATTGEVEQVTQPAMPAKVSEKVAEKSQRIEQAVDSVPADEKAAKGIAQVAKEITASPAAKKQPWRRSLRRHLIQIWMVRQTLRIQRSGNICVRPYLNV
jgi:hypothetical protein